MKGKNTLRSAWLSAVALGIALNSSASGKDSEAKKDTGVLGRRVIEFTLPDQSGKTVSMADFRDKDFVVVAFLGTECPVGNLYVPILNELQKKNSAIQVIGVNANPGDTTEKIAEHAKEFSVGFPVLRDAEQRVMDAFDASRTPEVYLLDKRRVVRYHGRIDDQFGVTYKKDQAERKHLEEAIADLTAGKPVREAETKPAGCAISRRPRAGSTGQVTYAKEISRIIEKKCQNCHRPGTSAPFSLLTYEDAVNWAEAIKENVRDGLMPPWHADPRHSQFSNDRRLTTDEYDLVMAWIDNGRPLGNAKDLPPAVKYDDSGWMIGKPDVIFKMPKQVSIKATGTVPYQYYQTETNFKEDVWIQAAEARPGNRPVVHHIILFMKPPAGAKKAAEGDQAKANPEGERPAARGPRRDGFRDAFLVGTAPGDMPLILPPGVGRKIPAGTTLVWQMHYTPTGKPETDQSEVGLIFCKEPPQYACVTRAASQHFFAIPPGAHRHKVESSFTFPEDGKLLSFMPHMHLRGREFRYTAVYPDGRREILLDVPRYDFNWQSTYRLTQPVTMPKGTKIECVAHFDNSKDNPANPDPTKKVVWGDQTWEEMMIGWFDYVPNQPIASKSGAPADKSKRPPSAKL